MVLGGTARDQFSRCCSAYGGENLIAENLRIVSCDLLADLMEKVLHLMIVNMPTDTDMATTGGR